MDAISIVLEKKFDIYVCQEDIVEFDGYVRIPLNVHNRLPDIRQLAATAIQHGYFIVSENDGDDNLRLYLQSKPRSIVKLCHNFTVTLFNILLLILSIYSLLVKLKF